MQILQTMSTRCCIWNSFVFGLLVLHYTSVCKMKRPLMGPILIGFYFYAQNLQTMSQGCCM